MLRLLVMSVVGLVFGGILGLGGAVASASEAPAGDAAAGASFAAPYQKPFLGHGTAALGGYFDFQFRAGREGSGFDLARFVPFIFAQVSDRVHLASEIEFEHGGFVTGEDEPTDGEISVEFATVDFRVNDALNFRAGIILLPLGRLNEFHDAPMLALTDRPLVDQLVIHTTLSENGLGAFGSWTTSGGAVLDYEAYAVNGLNEDAVEDGVLNLGEAEGIATGDNNNDRSFAGRVGVSPWLGTEAGVSLHSGAYSDDGSRSLTIGALDFHAARGRFEFLGEGALARASRQPLAGGPEPVVEVTPRSGGFYAEARVHVLQGVVRALPASGFTGTVRAGYVDRDRNTAGADLERLTVGVSFRPTEETVIKNDVLFDRAREAGAPAWGATQAGYRFSVATYF